MSGRRVDFFVSHAGRDTGWAEWLAWQLHQAGYSVELDVWDWAPGEDFVARMQTARQRGLPRHPALLSGQRTSTPGMTPLPTTAPRNRSAPDEGSR